jgi:hypothetical protein
MLEGQTQLMAPRERTNCGKPVTPRRRDYKYIESGLSILLGVEVAVRPSFQEWRKFIEPLRGRSRTAPARQKGEQIRFFRKHLGLSGEQLGCYLHTDRTKISKWNEAKTRLDRQLTGSSGCSRPYSTASCVPEFPMLQSIFRRFQTTPERFGSCTLTSRLFRQCSRLDRERLTADEKTTAPRRLRPAAVHRTFGLHHHGGSHRSVSRTTLSELINWKRRICPRTAEGLSRVFGGTPQAGSPSRGKYDDALDVAEVS